MAEDDLYRTSSQYRFWSFTPEKLESLRRNTNTFAAEQTRAAIKRKRAAKAANGVNGTKPNGTVDGEIDCLTPEEEEKLLSSYCVQCLEIGLKPPFSLPINVVGTAVQFLKRFYVSNSLMTYHPRQIFPAALFLATKTENCHYPLKDFAPKLNERGFKTNAEEVLAPEFIIAQGLRFCFDIKHPERALRGVHLELAQFVACAKGADTPAWINKPGDTFRYELLRLPKAGAGPAKSSIATTTTQPIAPAAFDKRVWTAHEEAKKILRSTALSSDAYFLYTPSQIMFAALYTVDVPLTELYLSLKLDRPLNPNTEISPFHQPGLLKGKVLTAIKECAALFAAESARLKENVATLDKKLYYSRNPEKIDLVGLNRAQKRDAIDEQGRLDEQVAKKRKLEREQSEREADDLFGPALPVK